MNTTPVSQALATAFMLSFSGCVLAEQAADAVLVSPAGAKPSFERPQKALSPNLCVPSPKDMIAVISALNAFLDASYEGIRTEEVPDSALQNHPFVSIERMLASAMADLKAIRHSAELNDDAREFIRLVAEARSKADRNAHLIRQMIVVPSVFHSEIDRDGLKQMAANVHAMPSSMM